MTPEILNIIETEAANLMAETTVTVDGVTYTDVMKTNKGLTYKQDHELSAVITEQAGFDWEFQGSYITDAYEEVLETFGFAGVRVYYSGFCSQGDGASFEGTYTYEKGWRDKIKECDSAYYAEGIMAELEALAALQRKHLYDARIDVTQRGHYYHANTMSAESDSRHGRTDQQYDRHGNISDEAIVFMRGIANTIYRTLDKEYGYLCTHKYWVERQQDNEHATFWLCPRGEVVHHDTMLDWCRDKVKQELES